MPAVLLSLPVLVTLGACGSDPNERPSQGSAADGILDAAERATGVAQYGQPLQLFADASVEGPNESFRTLMHSSWDGRVRMEQVPLGFLAGVGSSGGWLFDSESGEVADLGPVDAFVRGHELHMLALLPRSRLSNPRVVDAPPGASRDAVGVALSLPSEDSLVVYFSESDTLPIGLQVTYTDPHVMVTWSDWIERGGLQVFTKAVISQGEEVFEYSYDHIDVGPLPDSIFEAPRN